MPDLFNMSSEMNSYFNTLPDAVKENIIMSGAKINSMQDLKAIAEELTGNA